MTLLSVPFQDEPAAPKSADAVKVLVVDDSAVVRGLITRKLSADPNIEVVATAFDGGQAVRKVGETLIDVVVLDIDMPVMDGLTALPLILAARPGVKVIMVSALTSHMAEISLRALSRGASDYVSKPEGKLSIADAFQRELTSKVIALGSRSPPASPQHPKPKAARLAAVPAPSIGRRLTPEVIALGSSTGGPAALMTVLESLKHVRQPILVTQHMPPTFTPILAEHLSRASGKVCAEACEGETLTAGRVYVAPGDWHMTVERDDEHARIRLTRDPPEHFCRPAVDPMLRSLATAYGPALTAVIMTGMGSDGAAGCQAVSKAGGRFVVQDEATSVVWGMPAAASRTGLAERVLALPDIGPWLVRVAGAA